MIKSLIIDNENLIILSVILEIKNKFLMGNLQRKNELFLIKSIFLC